MLWPLLVTSSRDMYTVTQGLAIAGRRSGIYTGVALATAVMAILPVIVAYLFLQRYVIRSVVSSGSERLNGSSWLRSARMDMICAVD